jgi:DNA-binding MarR family transcriptional regulator
MMRAFAEWVTPNLSPAEYDFHEYVHNVAQARYVVRKVVRIVDEQAKRAGLDPLEHQALVQIYGARMGEALSVNRLAERLDVAPALASRLVKSLEEKSLVRRESVQADKRMSRLFATDDSVVLLSEIDSQIHVHVDYFHKQLEDADRLPALAICAFWVGLEADSRIAGAIRKAVDERATTKTPTSRGHLPTR